MLEQAKAKGIYKNYIHAVLGPEPIEGVKKGDKMFFENFSDVHMSLNSPFFYCLPIRQFLNWLIRMMLVKGLWWLLLQLILVIFFQSAEWIGRIS